MTDQKIKLGICQWCLPADESSMCKTAAELGLEGIELNFAGEWEKHSLAKKEIQRMILQQGEEENIAFPTVGINALCKVGMSKVANYRTVKEIFKRVIDIAASMEIALIQAPSFGDGLIQNEDELKQTMECLNFACEVAKDANIIVGTENAVSWEENLRIIKEINQENIRVYFDTQNPYVVNGYDVLEMVHQLYPYVCEIHAKDGANGAMGNTLFGKGEANVLQTMEQFKSYDYSGWVLFENNYDTLNLLSEDIKILNHII